MPETEFEFTLPLGFVDDDGIRHTHGVMRRATAKVIEELFNADFVYLQDFYNRVNETESG
jgi:hypothetical protein